MTGAALFGLVSPQIDLLHQRIDMAALLGELGENTVNTTLVLATYAAYQRNLATRVGRHMAGRWEHQHRASRVRVDAIRCSTSPTDDLEVQAQADRLQVAAQKDVSIQSRSTKTATRPLQMPRALGTTGDGIDLLTGQTCDWRTSASPALVTLASNAAMPSRAAKLRETLSTWRYANGFVYLESSHPPETVARMLKSRTDAVLPDNLRVLLRFFDSRIFDVLPRTLHPEQWLRFQSMASFWAYPDRRGALPSLVSAQTLGSDAFESPLHFDDAQERALIDTGEVDALIDILLNQRNATLMSMLPPDQYDRLERSLQKARESGLHELRDQIAYCSLDLELGPQFADEPPWSQQMSAVRTGRKTLNEVLSEMAEDVSS